MIRPEIAGAAVLLLLGIIVAILPEPTAEARLERERADLEEQIASRQFHIDPGELLEYMYDQSVRLVILDVRKESLYNLFHIRDAIWVPLDRIREGWALDLPPEAVKVVYCNREPRANEAWMWLRAQEVLNVYVLEGGVNGWLDAYAEGLEEETSPPPDARHPLRYRFTAALGDRYPFARPNKHTAPRREFERKIQIERAVSFEGGGCE